MADLLPSQFSPVGLRSAFRSDAEDTALAQMEAEQALAQNSPFGQGLVKGLHTMPAMLANAAGQVIEPFSTQFSQPVFNWASQQNQAAQAVQTRAPQTWRGVDSVGGGVDYAMGAIGENLPNALATIPAGIAARFGLRNAAMSPFAKNLAATSVAAAPMQMGEMAGAMREDPTIMANTTPLGRLGVAAGYGALTAPLEAADEALLMGRAMGAGKALKNIFKDGVGATVKDAGKHVAKAVPEAALTEGVPEVLQQATQQQVLGALNPQRDETRNKDELVDSFFKGWAAGGGTSLVGRGADVAWAQGRGATEAIKGLLQGKVLPESLKQSDDRSVLDWDNQDTEQRNSWAKDLADSILNSDASESLKASAKSFYEKAASGARDAWVTMSEAVGAEEKTARARDSIDRFFSAVKKTNRDTSKFDAEAEPFEADLYDNFTSHLDPKGAVARDTELKSRLYNTVKDSLLDDDWHHLPWTELEDHFGTIGRATDAVLKLRENLVRAGKLEHDDEFGTLFKATIKEGQEGERAMMDVVARYGTEYIKRKPADSELRETVRGIRNILSNPEAMRKHGKAFDATMKKSFGANAEKVIAALAPKNNVEAGIETEATSENKSTSEYAPGSRFVGSGVKALRKHIASDERGQNVVANHGGFWNLGHADEKVRGEIKARFNDTAADLRKDGNYVRALTPLEYAAEAGVAVRKVARHILGNAASKMSDAEIAAALKDHPARMLAVDERDMEKDKLSLDNDDLLNLADKLKEAFSAFDKGMPVRDAEQRGKIAAALGKKGHEQRTAMKELGLEHGVKLRMGKGGAFLENNPRHTSNGVFTVHMKDGTQHHISAQQLIATMRERGRGQFSNRSAFDMFNSGIAALMNLDGFDKITAQDVWGRVEDKPFELKKNKKTKRWENYFQLEPGLNLGQAQRASRRGKFKDKVMDQLEAEYAKAEESGDEDAMEEAQLAIDEELERRSELQDQMEGEGQREAEPGKRSATNDPNITPIEFNRETSLDFNDDGLQKHPYVSTKPVADKARTKLRNALDEAREGGHPAKIKAAEDALAHYDGKATGPATSGESDTKNISFTFNTVEMRVRPGVSGKHLTEGARKVIAVAKALKKIKDSPTFTSSRMDMALDLAARSAAAQKDGNIEARDAAIFAAADSIRQAALDEIEVAQQEGAEGAVAKLTDIAAKVIDLAAQYDPAKHDALLGDYKSFSRGKVSQDTRTPAQVQRDKADEQKKAVIKTTPQPFVKSKVVDPLQTARDDLQGKVDTQQAMADEAKSRAKADAATTELSDDEQTALAGGDNHPWMQLSKEERTERVEAAAAPVEQELTNLAKMQRSLGHLIKAVRRALQALKSAWVSGKLDRAELVTALRDSVKALIEAAGAAATVVQDSVRTMLAKYRKAGQAPTVEPVSREYGKRSGDEALEAAADAWFVKSGANIKYRPNSQHAKRVKAVASNISGMLDTPLEPLDHTDEQFADIGGFATFAYFAEKHGEFFQMTVPEKYLEQLGENPDFSKLLDASVLTLAYDNVDGDMAVFGPYEGTSAAKDFASHIEQTGNDLAPTRFNGVSKETVTNLMGELHARLQKQRGEEHINYKWERKTGAAQGKFTENLVHAARFNAEGSFATGKGVTPEEFAAAKEYVAKVLGPKVKVELVKTLGGNSAAWNRVSGEAIIRIAAGAANPMSKAHHEAMHEFFQRLMEAHPEAAEVLRTAANNPLVKRQIEQFFHNDANYAKIKDAIDKDEHERVAYMFQLWAAGKLNVGPKTQTWFQKVAAFLRSAFGMLNNAKHAEAIMQAFHDGKMSEPNAVAEVLAQDKEAVQSLLDRAAAWGNPIENVVKELLYTAQNTLIESGNAGFEKIGRLFSTETGHQAQGLSFMDAKTMKTNQMNDRLWALLHDKDTKDIEAALEGLQQGKTSNDPQIAALQGRVRKFLDQMHDYAKNAGMDMRKVENYFPRVWDAMTIAENKAEFIKMLQDDHLAVTGQPLADATATEIATNMVRERGHEPVNENELSNGYSPFMAAGNKRVLDFIKNPDFAKFQEKSMEGILTNYIAQLVHKAEYTRRFGANGTKLRDMVIDAVGEEVGPEWAAAKAAAQATLEAKRKALKGKPRGEITRMLAEGGYRYGEIQIEHVVAELKGNEANAKFDSYEHNMLRNIRAIMAMEGTLGADINPEFRKVSAALMVYENMRLLGLSLFSQVIDPLGVMVRGGTLAQSWDTFKRGIASTIAAWKGTPMEDRGTKLAMQLGTIDAGGYLNSQANAYTSLYMGKTATKWNDRLFRVNGVEGFSQGTRVGATLAAISFLKHHKGLPTEHSERWLAELGLTPKDIKLKGDELDYADPKIQQAIFRWVEGAILRPNASMRPIWASDPHFALVFHLKQFTYAMQKVLLERMAHEIKNGNYDPAITAALTYVPAIIAADFIRGLVANGGEEPPWKRKWSAGDYIAEGVQRSGLLGVPQLGLDVAKWGPAELAGPAGEQVWKVGKNFRKEIERDARLDEVAETTQAPKDIERAASFSGVESAAKKSLRDALPINSLTKRYIYDEVVGK